MRETRLVLADERGDVFVHPRLSAPGEPGAWTSLPKGAILFRMPGHLALGRDPSCDEIVPVPRFAGRRVLPVAAFPTPGYLRLAFPAARKTDERVVLPLWPYTAVGWRSGRFVMAAVRVETQRRQQPFYYADRTRMEKGIREFRRRLPSNRLVRHLAHCARVYNCRNAQDLFLRRGEAPLPVAPACNARCRGCLSGQKSPGIASHERIRFVPTPRELAEIAVAHLSEGRGVLASFGQGCEGEPLLETPVVAAALKLVRRSTRRGTLHMNTNGYSPARIRLLAEAGLDSVRISVNSLDPAAYAAYYRPRGYGLADVLAAIRQAHQSGMAVALNYLVLPGFSDAPRQERLLRAFLKKGYVDTLQLRNWCGDPHGLPPLLRPAAGQPVRVSAWLEHVREALPDVKIGTLNRRTARGRPGQATAVA
ncbi:MAG: radical SAM protein [Deltaproteobacteria bacterium]